MCAIPPKNVALNRAASTLVGDRKNDNGNQFHPSSKQQRCDGRDAICKMAKVACCMRRRGTTQQRVGIRDDDDMSRATWCMRMITQEGQAGSQSNEEHQYDAWCRRIFTLLDGMLCVRPISTTKLRESTPSAVRLPAFFEWILAMVSHESITSTDQNAKDNHWVTHYQIMRSRTTVNTHHNLDEYWWLPCLLFIHWYSKYWWSTHESIITKPNLHCSILAKSTSDSSIGLNVRITFLIQVKVTQSFPPLSKMRRVNATKNYRQLVNNIQLHGVARFEVRIHLF